MHGVMQYDPIQGQVHVPLKFRNPSVYISYVLRHLQWKLATDN